MSLPRQGPSAIGKGVELGALVETRALSRRYGAGTARPHDALVDVTLSIDRGAFAVVTGPSGGGKTTLLSLVGALDRATSGQVLVNGVDLGAISDAERTRVRRRIGFVFQGSPMLHGLTAWENVTYPLVPLGVRARDRRARAQVLLERVGLAAMMDSPPESASGGELQRIGIARALVGSPTLVVADEPTSSLDRRSADAVAGLLREIHASGTTVLVATHDPHLVGLATVRFELESGTLVASER